MIPTDNSTNQIIGSDYGVSPSGGVGGSFTPTSIAGLLAWWDFSALALNNNDPISSVSDSSGNSNNLSQATGINQPLFKTNITNGKAMGLFDGINDEMTCPLTATTNPITIFTLIRPLTSFAVNTSFLGCSAAGGLELRFNTSGKQEALNANVVSIGTATNAESLNVAVDLGFTYNTSGNFAFYTNGIANGSGTNFTPFSASTVVVGESVAPL